MTGRAKRVIRELRTGAPAGPSVSAGYVQALLRFAVRCGADRDSLVRRAGLDLADLADRDARVPLSRCAALMAAAAADGAPGFALRFGAALTMEDISVALLAAGAAGTVAEGVGRFNRLGSLVMDDGAGGGSLRLARDRRGPWLEFRTDAARPFVEAGFVWCARQMRAQAGEGAVRAVELRGPPAAEPAEYERAFAAPVAFGAERDALLLDERLLSLTLPSTHSYVSRLIEERAQALLEDLEAGRSVRGRVEGLLAGRLASGTTDMGLIARDLGVSRQTLRRRLAGEGCRFEQVLDDLRRRLAVELLAVEEASVKAVAARLGFSEPAAFSRAFKRWTGSSPGLARRTTAS